MAAKEGSNQQLEMRQSEDFSSVYANNVAVEPTAWDLKLIFGESAQGVIDQHTSVTLPWGVVKLLIHLLRSQVLAFEIQHGKINVLPGTLPAEVIPPPEELENNPLVQKTYEELKKLREELIRSL